MNQGRIWCVVKPTVGLPLFLGSVATISLLVHASVLTNTTWMANYWQGAAPRTPTARTSEAETIPPVVVAATQPGTPAFSVTVSPVTDAAGATTFVVTVTPAGTPAGTPLAERPAGNTFALAGSLPD